MTIGKTENRDDGHSHRWGLALVCLGVMVAGPAPLLAQPDSGPGDVITIEGGQIHSEQELPTVLYLVPWQPVVSRGPEPMERQLMTGEPPDMVEREAFRRQLDYHQTRLEQRSQDTQE